MERTLLTAWSPAGGLKFYLPPAGPLPPQTLVQLWDLTVECEERLLCSSLILASLYLCRFQFKMAFPDAFLNPNTNNSF